MNVGFIGLGAMGQPMARNLIKAGHTVTVYNRTRQRAQELAAEGARVALSAAAACGGEAVITMVADDRAVEDVVLNTVDFMRALPPNAVHVSMSTISVALSRQLAEAHAKAGHAYVAAPVLGRPDAAAAAKLFVIAAGAPAAIERCRPLFDAMGQTFVMSADPPVANAVKLSATFLIGSVLESLGEALALARKYGVEPRHYLEFLTSSLFGAPVFETYGNLLVEEKFHPPGFKAALALKDARLVLAEADAAAVPMPLASLVYDRLLSAVARGLHDHDWSIIGRLVAEEAGLAPPSSIEV